MSKTSIITSIIFIVTLNQSFGQIYILGSGGATGTVTTCSGTFYDPGGLGDYATNLDHSITFTTGDPTKVMAVEFISFALEDDDICRWDYLDIYDGTNSSAPYLGRYCRNAPGESVVGTGEALHFIFHSDDIIVASGWEANIYCLDNPCLTGDYEDQFASSNYSNSNGSISWTSESWIEAGDDGSPSTGRIIITGDALEFSNTDGNLSVERAVDLTGATSAVLYMEYDESGNFEFADFFFVDIFDGTSYNRVLSTTNDFPNGTIAQIDISDYANADTRVRITGRNSVTGETYFVDILEICFTAGVVNTLDFTLEAECGFIGSSWSTLEDPAASDNFFVEPKVGLNSLLSAPADTSDFLTYIAQIDTAGDYELYARVQAPTTDNESFWVRVNNGTWYKWDNLGITTDWTWRQVWDSDNGDTPLSFTLPEGRTNIDFAYREEGTQLDKLFLTLEGTIPTGLGDDATNCTISREEDTDGDGIANKDDLDDDNDGILDVDESPATIDFSNSRSVLNVGANINDLDVGDVVLYADAVRDCDDILYDIVITINSISPGVRAFASAEGMEIDDASAAQDDHFTFTLSVVESGSATTANPAGTPATIDNFLFTPRDIDSNVGINHTEVIGISDATPPDMVSLSSTTVLENAGFINGSGPGAGYTYYRMFPLDGPTNWTSNDNDGINSPDFAVFMFYANFSSVTMAFGRTGSAGSGSGGNRLTSLFASKECDRDMDGVPNSVDLDLDNDGIFDLHEAGHNELDLNDDGRIDGADTGSGANGLFDGIETASESGILNYTYSDSDGSGIEDPFDRDSDEDGCFDTEEADVSDTDNDGIAGSGIPSVDVNGLVVSIVYIIPPNNAWQDPLASCLEICGNGLDDDGDGLIDDFDSDCANFFLEAECGFPGGNWDRGSDVEASNGDFLTISPGLNSIAAPPTGADDLVRFTVTVTSAGLYRLLARVYSANGADDSFWVRIDGGTWYNWNDWNTASTWQWLPITDNDNGNTLVKFSLTAGVHTIDFGYREDGARLDKLHLTINGTTPVGEGEESINCGRTITYNLFLPHKVLNRN